MEDIQRLAQPVSAFVFIPVTASLAEACTQVQGLDEQSLIVVGQKDTLLPCTLVEKAALVAVQGEEGQTLATLLDKLPYPVFISDGLIEDLGDVADLLATNKSPGLLLFQHHRVIGIIPISSIVQALSPAELGISMRKATSAEQQSVRKRAFICLRCEQEDPPAYKLELIQGDEAPPCGKWPTLHGTQFMEERSL